ncbi:hypothetical protein C5B99_01575 [Pseudoclavibacter sp. Z016]|nr:hypothetical protein C5B99_01575 [Pseudoclavibacter sp. Z016]
MGWRQLDAQDRKHPETTKASEALAGGGVMKTNTVTKTSELDPTTSSGAGDHRPASSGGGGMTASRDEHGLPTGAALREWRRAHPRATIADAIAADPLSAR